MGDELGQEFARLRNTCTLSDGREVAMPPTGTGFEQHMLATEPHWITLGRLLPGVEVSGGYQLQYRSAAALKLIRNHEAVIRDVCNPLDKNVVGNPLTQPHQW